jgi:transposase InsO family protein
LRHDWEPQYRSAHFTGSLAWLGISDDPAFLGEPETNGCAERWIRTLKDQCLWVQLHDTIDELRQAVAGFVDRYNRSCSSSATATGLPRRPTRQHNRHRRHDRTDTNLSKEPSAVHSVLVQSRRACNRDSRRSSRAEVSNVL